MSGEDDDFDVSTDEDEVFAPITPEKTNAWYFVSEFFAMFARIAEDVANLFAGLSVGTTKRALYERERRSWAHATQSEIENFGGFYIQLAETEDEPDTLEEC